jgi:FkbM family methyltransferase
MKVPPASSKDVLKTWATQVRDKLPLAVRKRVGQAGRFFGTDLVYPNMALSLRNLARLGFRPRFIVDVGAYEGHWTALCKTYFPEANVLMIEAQQSKADVLSAFAAPYGGQVTTEIALLGPVDGLAVAFHEMETGSSVLAENSPAVRTTSQRTTVALDGLLSSRPQRVDFLKLDVQGYELEVLKGGSRALQEAEFVLMETSLMPVNQGCPTFAEVVAFMDGRGFRVFDLCDQGRRRDGVLWQVDLLFMKQSSPLAPDPSIDHTNWGSGGSY